MIVPASALRPSLGWDQICAERTKILSTFDHARTHSRSHEVEVYHGHVAQSEIRRWLTEFLPKKYGVTSGYVISTGLSIDDDNPHFDVIIYDQLNSPVLWVEEHPGTGDHGKSLAIPVEFVLCVLEVKSRLTIQTARHAIDHLGDLLPLMQNVDPPDQRYKKFLPVSFSCGAVFFDLMQKDANSDTMLEAFVDGLKLRGFFGGLVLRQEGLATEASSKLELYISETAHSERIPPGEAFAFVMSKSVEMGTNQHCGAMLMATPMAFTEFAFDLVARLQGTYERGKTSSFHSLGVALGLDPVVE